MRQEADEADIRIDIDATIAALPAQEGMAVRLLYQGYTVCETAQIMCKSTRFVYSILKNIRVYFI